MAWPAGVEQDTAVGWLAGLLSTAHAHESHDLPGDWWAVSVDGGTLQCLSWLSMTVTQLGLARVQPESGETDWLWTARTLRAVDTAP